MLRICRLNGMRQRLVSSAILYLLKRIVIAQAFGCGVHTSHRICLSGRTVGFLSNKLASMHYRPNKTCFLYILSARAPLLLDIINIHVKEYML